MLFAVVLAAEPGRSFSRDYNDGSIYSVDESGVSYSGDGGESWEQRNEGLPIRKVYPFDDSEIQTIASISVDPVDTRRIAVATESSIFASDTGGLSWDRVPVSFPISPVDTFTSIALVPGSEQSYYVGTSFNTLFLTADGGVSWRSFDESLDAIYKGAGFYEEIQAIVVSPSDPTFLIIVAGFGGGAYFSEDAGSTWKPFAIPGTGAIADIYYTVDSDPMLIVERDSELHIYYLDTWRSELSEEPGSRDVGTKNPDRKIRAMGRNGIYVNSQFATGERLEGHLELLDLHGLNSLIVDMKDDAGYLTYDTNLDLPREADAVRERFELDTLVATVHERDLYLIGRIVVFQDRLLYHYEDSKYAVWDAESDVPWGNFIPIYGDDGEIVRREQREFWVDPYAQDVWRYHISIARELESRGVDEIQFDYIRFPSDGDLSNASYRYRRPGMSKADALESFLALARESLDIPIGIDIFGFNGWYRMGNWIGQSLPRLARWVDVVSPMFYPSHYPRSFLPSLGYFERARAIYREGSDRATEIVDDSIVIRPYVQAFLIGSERNYEEEEYWEYLEAQLEGVRDSSASGFTLWNASNKYYMIVESLEEYTDAY